jgi:hypothetical protein
MRLSDSKGDANKGGFLFLLAFSIVQFFPSGFLNHKNRFVFVQYFPLVPSGTRVAPSNYGSCYSQKEVHDVRKIARSRQRSYPT